MTEQLTVIAKNAGAAIMRIYAEDFAVEYKADDSPLTRADSAAHEVIMEGLSRHFPDIPVLSEEGAEIPYAERRNWKTFWLVDPLDGTKEFIKKNGEFTVNIALIENGAPTAGVVYAPALDTLYTGSADGAYRVKDGQPRKMPFAEKKPGVTTVVASRSHMSDETKAFIDGLAGDGDTVEMTAIGSSLKLCLVAEGTADVYPRLGPTMEWDTAAAHAVVRAAGRNVVRHDTNEPLTYNKENLLNPWFVVS